MENNNIATATTTTSIATSSAKFKEVPESFSYMMDGVFIILFLIVFFFMKPDKNLEKELPEEEKPNPLEQVLRTDSENEDIKEEENIKDN